MSATTRNPAPCNAPIARLLSRLDGVREVGPSKWIARCPAHDDKSPSLSIRETNDGRVLLHCFSGCTSADVLSAIGLSLSDLFPEAISHYLPKARITFPALPILKALAFESSIVFYAGAKMLAGETFSDDDNDRLVVALGRIDAALRVAEGRT